MNWLNLQLIYKNLNEDKFTVIWSWQFDKSNCLYLYSDWFPLRINIIKIFIMEEDFMEVDWEDGDGWFDEDDEVCDHYKDPKFEVQDSSYIPKLTSGFQFTIIDTEGVAK